MKLIEPVSLYLFNGATGKFKIVRVSVLDGIPLEHLTRSHFEMLVPRKRPLSEKHPFPSSSGSDSEFCFGPSSLSWVGEDGEGHAEGDKEWAKSLGTPTWETRK